MNKTTRSILYIDQLDCSAEEQLIGKRLASMPEVKGSEFDIVNRRVLVTHDEGSIETVASAIRSLGMTVRDTPNAGATAGCEGGACETDHEPTPSASRERWLLGASGLLAFGSEITSWVIGSERTWLTIAMAFGAILLGGLPTLRKGWVALRTLTLNINLLMTIAVIGAFAIGEYPEAAMVVFLFAVAELIERYSLDRARNAVRALMEMAPETATAKQPDGTWKSTGVSNVAAGSIIRVSPGERIALDGVVVAGRSAVDQSPITGESIPVEKKVDDKLFAGTINGDGVLELRTTGGKDDTTIARIIRTVQDAQGQRAPTQRFVDRFARVYTPVVVVLAVLVAVLPWLLFSQPFIPWLYKSLVLLVIACPCALVISTPVTVVSGLAAAARRGILIKGGVYLEEGRKLRVIALDKTGTITRGRPSVTDVIPLGGESEERVRQLAASIDAGSDHPVARAVIAAYAGSLLPTSGQRSITGRGVEATIDGQVFVVGNHRLAEERKVCSPEVERELEALEGAGKTAIIVANSTRSLGVMGVADTARETSIAAIAELHRLGIRTLMLSGDNTRTATAIAKSVGIDEARGELLPEDKLKAMDELLQQYKYVGMVGDGVNDAPALAKASIGFAMGVGGTDTAIETADVALMHDDLRSLPEFITLSRKASNILTQNISFAVGLKLLFFILALFNMASLWMAVVADLGASLVVVLNGLRLLRSGRSVSKPVTQGDTHA
jgi:Cd2+/Zn2+-exporting ATPase